VFSGGGVLEGGSGLSGFWNWIEQEVTWDDGDRSDMGGSDGCWGFVLEFLY
jgi:hypothetical protein